MPSRDNSYLLDRPRECWKRADWWLGVPSGELTSRTAGIAHALQEISHGAEGSPLTLVLTDRDPLDFLCAAIAGLEAGCNLVLGSAEWDTSHFQQITDWVSSPVVRIHQQKPQPLTSLSSGSQTTSQIASQTTRDNYPSPWIAIATGGSSGKFKLAVHTPQTLTASALGFQKFMGGISLNSFLTLPLYHISGWMTVWRAWTTGGKVTKLPNPETPDFHPDEWIVSLVPTQLYRELQASQTSLPYSRLRAILIGGASLSPELASQARDRQWPLVPVYGMTETAALTSALPANDFLNGASGYGYPLPHAKVTIREPDSEGAGQVQIESPSLYLGYLGEPARQTPFHEPQDLGYLDAQGSLHILGRTDSIIISGGKKISPEPIEQLLLQHPSIQDAAVCGIPDTEWGERLVSFIKWKSDNTTDEQNSHSALKAWLEEKLPRWQIPKEFVIVDQLPRNRLGKLQRSHLLAYYQESQDHTLT